MYVLGFDIGGTKCAVITANYDGANITLINKAVCPTDLSITPEEMINKLIDLADGILTAKPEKIGVSCGGPLDADNGVILSPPNLKGWDNIHIVKILENEYCVPVKLQNDANACALAEWKFGAGKGSKNMVFMTFGTGLGAGLILDGKLYNGTNGNAGEIGHVRLAENGPIGYGKNGSFEGFCSGGGISQLGYTIALESVKKGIYPSYFKDGMSQKDITAKAIAEAALSGDETALDVYRISGKFLGKGISILIDILNPEVIVIGSIFARNKDLLLPFANVIINFEALKESAKCCRIETAALGENIGDYGAIATAVL